MANTHRFFENKECKYFPCHEGLEEFNCLFCYCPLYHRENCPGNPQYTEKAGKKIKVCAKCTFPHRPENYDVVVRLLKKGENKVGQTTQNLLTGSPDAGDGKL